MPIAQTLMFAAGEARARHPGTAARAVPAPAIEIIETCAGLTRLGPEWNELFARAGRPMQVFQTHAFAETWARTYLPGTKTRLAIVTGWVGGRLAMVWPLVMDRSGGLEILSWLGAPIAQYGDVLLAPEPQAQGLLDAAWSHICRRLAPDVVRLRKVRADAAVAPLLARADTYTCCREEAAAVELGAKADGGVSTASFEDRQPAKARKNRRRLLRRLEEQGAVRFAALEPGTTAAQAAAQGLAMKRRWLADRSLYSAAFADRSIEDFFAAVAGPGAEAAGCRVFSLSVDGTPIAVAIGFETARRLTLHMIAYDIDREKCGAGVLNLEAILRWAEARGVEVVDLLAPKAAYKMDWADSTTPVCDHSVAVTIKGHVGLRIVEGMLRPVAKAALAHLPTGLTRLITCRGC